MERSVRESRASAWAARWAEHPVGPALLMAMAFLEACAFPAPTEALLVALGLGLGRPARAWRMAALATAASLAGALAGYALGAAFLDEAARPLLARFGGEAHWDRVGELYRGGLFAALATSGFTPIPYFVYTTAAGAYHAPLLPFIAGATVGRAIKYAVYGGAARVLGPLLRRILPDRRAWIIAIVVLAAAMAIVAFLLI